MKASTKILTGAAALLPCCLPIAMGEESSNNMIDIGVGGAFSSGDKAAYQQRVGQDGDFYGGLRGFHMESIKDDMTYSIDGHAIFGNADYEFIVKAMKENLGYLEMGYSEFRTWYDGSGGYYPDGGDNGSIVTPFDDDLSLDRGAAWLEAGLQIEDLPEVIFRYEHQWRKGKKDSTIWGRAATDNGSRAYVPTLYDIDEQRDLFSLDVRHTISDVDLGLGVRYDKASNDNTRFNTRDYDTGKAIDHNDQYEMDLFTSHVFAKKWFNEKMFMSSGYAFTTLDSDFDGSDRVYNFTTSSFDHGYQDLVGGSQMKLHVVNATMWWNPVEDLVIVPSVRAEWEDTSARLFFAEMSGATPHPAIAASDIDQTELSEQLELRYSGVENVLFYMRGEWSQAEADRWISESIDAVEDARVSDTDKDINKYTVGANWYPLQKVSLSTEYYYKKLSENWDYSLTDLDAMMDSRDIDTHDFNVRVTWRALSNLTLVTRYDYQTSEYDQNPHKAALGSVESGEVTRHILSESATWTINPRLYLQGNIYLVKSSTDTSYDYTTSGAEYVPDWDNDYISASLNAGYVISDKATLTAGISYYGADNYVNNQLASTPYGASTDEYILTFGYTREINPNMIWNMRYAFYTSEDDAAGGQNDFDAHMLSSGLQVRF